MLELFIKLVDSAMKELFFRIDKASLLETFASLTIRNFGYTPSYLQLLRKSMFNFTLLYLCLYYISQILEKPIIDNLKTLFQLILYFFLVDKFCKTCSAVPE